MAVEISDLTNGILTVRITGRLSETELNAFQSQVAAILSAQSESKVRLLVLAQAFDGWEQGGNWIDFTGQQQLDSRIERMAIVGQRRWEEQALLFAGKGLRPFPIAYFAPDELPEARTWLGARAE